MITDYDTLKAEIAANLRRSDINADSDSIVTDIQLSESFISRKLRVAQMEKEQAITTTASQNYADLNSDFLSLRNLEFVSTPKNIEFVPLTNFKKLTINEGSGRPRVYTIGNNPENNVQALIFAATPDAEYALTLTYVSKIPALSDSNTTNWLIEYDPELYLNTCLYFAFRRLRNTIAGEYLQLTNDRIEDMNKENQISKSGPSGTRTRVRGAVV